MSFRASLAGMNTPERQAVRFPSNGAAPCSAEVAAPLDPEVHLFPCRFGVRALPKRQMVLKLKEIFQYTHQTLESDSEHEIQSSQLPCSPEVPGSQASTAETYKPSRSGGYTQIKATAGLGAQRAKGPTKTKNPQHQEKQRSESVSYPSRLPAGEPPVGPVGDALLPASQESVASSVDGSDNSFSSHR